MRTYPLIAHVWKTVMAGLHRWGICRPRSELMCRTVGLSVLRPVVVPGSSPFLPLLAIALALPTLHAGTLVQSWATRYDSGHGDYVIAVAADNVGNVAVTGQSDGSGSVDYYTAKYAGTDGHLLWERRYDGPVHGNDYAVGVAMDNGGNVIVTGRSVNASGMFDDDYYTVKYASADGHVLWEKRYNGPAKGDDKARNMVVDGVDNVIVTGSSATGKFSSDCYTAKYAAADGHPLWETRHHPAGSYAIAYGITVDTNGNVIVCGSTEDIGGQYNCYIAKYAAIDGQLLWEQSSIPGSFHYVTVDGVGNVVVAGSVTAKFAAGDGHLLWSVDINNYLGQVTVDGEGNVVLVGFNKNSVGNDDFYTEKYAAADGALLWEVNYNGPANSDDHGDHVAVDNAGDVFVTGSSVNGDGNKDYYTAKYAAVDGHLLWEKGYDGPTNSDDRMGLRVTNASKIALTPDGGVVVAGQSSNGNDYDYATVKYGPPTDLQEWKLTMFGDADTPDTGDGDGDGWVNLVEYALTTSPTTPTAIFQPTIYAEGGGMYLRLDFNFRTPSDATIEAQAASEVSGPWMTVATSIKGAPMVGAGVITGGPTTRAQVRDTVPMSAAAQRFLRLRVSH